MKEENLSLRLVKVNIWFEIPRLRILKINLKLQFGLKLNEL